MNIYSYNPKVRYSPNHGRYLEMLKGEQLSVQSIVINAKGSSFTAKFPNIFADYEFHSGTAALVGEWQSHPFSLWSTQLNFATYCATSACGISMQHLQFSLSMVRAVYYFHVYFQIRKILAELDISLPGSDSFRRLNNPFNMQKFRQLAREFGVSDSESVWRNETLFSSWQAIRKDYPGSGPSYFDEDSWSRWIIETSQGFTRIGLERLSQSVRFYAYLILESQANARSNIIGNQGSSIDAQRLYLTTFENLIIRPSDTRKEISGFQNVLKYARSKVDFSVAHGVYIIPSDMSLHIGSVVNFTNIILISKEYFSIGVNPKINRLAATHEHRLAATHEHARQSSTQQEGGVTLPLGRGHNAKHEDTKAALITGGVGLILLYIWLRK